ncbi:hypothetical protein PCASD_03315 [Puccinia coronata f. sp. avenae]|uniref:Uncharacterized protein n=1 Tax=Puccinia coronata f. sp. avenae TaxID=200324 RepID=A0A2N5VDX9_9BASI|nr:hypothetical protein PCASD_03315 [Puccinia coronata f. sp. avenae]
MADRLTTWDPALVDTVSLQLHAVPAESATSPTSSAGDYPSPNGETPDPPPPPVRQQWRTAHLDAKMKAEEQAFCKAHIAESLRHANAMNKLGNDPQELPPPSGKRSIEGATRRRSPPELVAPPPPPTGTIQEPPLHEKAIEITKHLMNFLAEATNSLKNHSQSINIDGIIEVLVKLTSLKTALTAIPTIEPPAEDKPANQMLAKIADQLERRTLAATTPPPTTWALVAPKNNNKKKSNVGHQEPPIPTSQEINKFKKASVVIRTPPGFAALDTMLATEITAKINRALASINASVDSKIIEVAGIARLPSKDLKIFNSTRAQAQWLLTNKHLWTELVCTDLKTLPSQFPVNIHAIPTNFDQANQTDQQELGKHNQIDPTWIQSAQWLGDPVGKGKKNGLIVLQLPNKELAHKIEKNGLFLQNELYQGAHYTQSIPPCFQCWKMRHTA